MLFYRKKTHFVTLCLQLLPQKVVFCTLNLELSEFILIFAPTKITNNKNNT